MKQRKRPFCLLLIFLWIMAGCGIRKQEQSPVARTVVQIQITCRQNGETLTRSYVESSKIEQILTYLRLLRPKNTQSKPEVPEPIYEIRLFFADGTRRIYRQQSHYIQVDSKNWQQADAEQTARLYSLLLAIPTDL